MQLQYSNQGISAIGCLPSAILIYTERKQQAVWQIPSQLYFKKVPGMKGWLGKRAADLLRERPLESDSSELDSELSVSTCVTLGSWLDLPQLQLPNKLLQRPYRKWMFCSWHAFYWVWLWIYNLGGLPHTSWRGKYDTTDLPWTGCFSHPLVGRICLQWCIPHQDSLCWSVVSRADMGNQLTLLTSYSRAVNQHHSNLIYFLI